MMKKITAICLCAMFLILTGCMETEDDLSRMKEMAKNATVNEDLNITFCAEVKDIQSDDLMQKLDLPKNTVIKCVQKNNIYALWDASDRYGDEGGAGIAIYNLDSLQLEGSVSFEWIGQQIFEGKCKQELDERNIFLHDVKDGLMYFGITLPRDYRIDLIYTYDPATNKLEKADRGDEENMALTYDKAFDQFFETDAKVVFTSFGAGDFEKIAKENDKIKFEKGRTAQVVGLEIKEDFYPLLFARQSEDISVSIEDSYVSIEDVEEDFVGISISNAVKNVPMICYNREKNQFYKLFEQKTQGSMKTYVADDYIVGEVRIDQTANALGNFYAVKKDKLS